MSAPPLVAERWERAPHNRHAGAEAANKHRKHRLARRQWRTYLGKLEGPRRDRG